MLKRLPLPLRNYLTTLLWYVGGYLAATGAYDIWQGRTDPPSVLTIWFAIVITAGLSWGRTKSHKSDAPVAEAN